MKLKYKLYLIAAGVLIGLLWYFTGTSVTVIIQHPIEVNLTLGNKGVQ